MINSRFLNIKFNNNLYTIKSKHFFLKYMQRRGIIPEVNISKTKNKSEVQQGINLKELLDEKNIQINLSDIMTDYRYFKRDYYYIDLNPPKEKPNLPFDNKEISFKKIIHFYFIRVRIFLIDLQKG